MPVTLCVGRAGLSLDGSSLYLVLAGLAPVFGPQLGWLGQLVPLHEVSGSYSGIFSKLIHMVAEGFPAIRGNKPW